LCLISTLFFSRIFRSKPQNLKGKQIFITGAAQGIGKFMSILFAQEQCDLLLCDIDAVLLKKTAEEISEKYPNLEIIWDTCDVSNPETVKGFIQKSKQNSKHTCPDVIINNAGVVSGKRFLDLTPRDITRTMSVNVMAHFWIIQEYLPDMIKRNSGHIVTIASTCGFIGAVGLSDYCASKHAVLGFHESLRVEIRRLKAKIDTTVICPNTINTGMFEGTKQGLQWLVPVLKPEQVARAIVSAVKYKKNLVILPKILQFGAPLIRADILPLWLKDFAGDLAGISSAMDTFVGRNSK